MMIQLAEERQVVQCRCERSLLWRGEVHAILAGWRHRRTPEGEALREWCCPDCAPPRTTAPPAAYKLPDYLRHLIGCGYEDFAVEQLDLLRLSDPERFEVCIGTIEREAHAALALRLEGSMWIALTRRYGREIRAYAAV
jgi:hypothetical protein